MENLDTFKTFKNKSERYEIFKNQDMYCYIKRSGNLKVW